MTSPLLCKISQWPGTVCSNQFYKLFGCKKTSPFLTNHWEPFSSDLQPLKARILLDWWIISLALTSLTPWTPLALNLTGLGAALAFVVAAVAARLRSPVGSILHQSSGDSINGDTATATRSVRLLSHQGHPTVFGLRRSPFFSEPSDWPMAWHWPLRS